MAIDTWIQVVQSVLEMHKNQLSKVISGVILGICSAVFIVTSPGHSADMRDSKSYLEQTIVSLHKARNSVVKRHYPPAQNNAEAARSNEDILTFIAYLDGRIYHYCRTLYLDSGPDSLEGLPCPTTKNLKENVFDSVPVLSGQTSGEKLAQLDQELKTALGEFDDMLLKEQDSVAAHIPRQRESGGSEYDAQNDHSSGSEGGSSAGGATGEQKSTDPGSQKSGSSAEGGHSSEGAGRGKTGESRLPPTEGPKDLSEADDDIVARQLREAAEQETDPEVKEKLWEEYRKYKEGIK